MTEAMSIKEYWKHHPKSLQWIYKRVWANDMPDGVLYCKDSAGVKILFVDKQWLRKNPVLESKKV